MVGKNGQDRPNKAQWSTRPNGDSAVWGIYDQNGTIIGEVDDEKDAKLIVAAVNEYLDIQLGQLKSNTGIPHKTTLAKSVMDAIRKSRQQYMDRALFGVIVYGEYGNCVIHEEGSCPQYNVHDITKYTCRFEANSFIMDLPDRRRVRVKLEYVPWNSSAENETELESEEIVSEQK